jgi:site-specific DNA recombinase
MRWNTPTAWVWSTQVVHQPLVSDEDFQRVQDLIAGKKHRQTQITTVKRTRHPYQLRGLLFCGICLRRMQGSWNNEKPHYRCVYPTEYGLANHTQHPRSIYVREESIVPALDRWLVRAFSPTALPNTIQALVDAQGDPHDEEQLARATEAKRILADCDQRLARYRAALEAGTDPTLIARWTAEVNTTRAAAQAQLRGANGGSTRMSADEINAIVAALGNILDVLRDADPADKAKIYSGVGLKLTYQPAQTKSSPRQRRRRSCTKVRVRGWIDTVTPPPDVPGIGEIEIC